MTNLLWLLFGLLLLILGGEAVVRGALAAARRLGVSPLLAGLVIVGMGTSAPELVVSLKAVANEQPEIALGNVIGSNIANILLILGMSALIMPLKTHLRCLQRDGLTMLLATLIFIGLASDRVLSLFDGLLMLSLLAVYLVWAYRSEKADTPTTENTLHELKADELVTIPMTGLSALIILIGGFALLIYGADRFLFGAVGLARTFGVPDTIIGLTIVAVGTSLPEIAASIVAAVRREADLAVGNIIGSNIFNTLLILGSASVLSVLPFVGRLHDIDQWVMLGATLLLLSFLFFGLKISRTKGAFLLVAYMIYIGSMVT